MKNKLEKKLIGEVAVDSGQIMVIDPCYLDKWEDNEFEYEKGIKKGDKEYLYMKDFNNWNEPIDAEKGRTANQLRDDGWKEVNRYPDEGDFSYSGVCAVTCGKDYGNISLGFATSTKWGDGCFPVFGYFESGSTRPSKIEIVFDE